MSRKKVAIAHKSNSADYIFNSSEEFKDYSPNQGRQSLSDSISRVSKVVQQHRIYEMCKPRRFTVGSTYTQEETMLSKELLNQTGKLQPLTVTPR